VAEAKVLSAFRNGAETNLRQIHRSSAGDAGSGGTRRPHVRAGVITEMLCGGPDQGRIGRLILRGAHITGQLDLSYARIDHPLIMHECTFDKPVVLTGARLGGFVLSDCALEGIDARNVELEGDLALRSVTCDGTVDVGGAHFHHDLDLEGAHLSHGKGTHVALRAAQAKVDGSVYCRGDFTAAGTVDMTGARIQGTVSLNGATIEAESPLAAFEGDGMTVRCSFSGKDLKSTGEVRFVDANIVGSLELSGAKLHNPGRISLRFDRAQISGSVYCDASFLSAGEVAAIGAHVNGTVYFNNAELGAPVVTTGNDASPKNAVALRLMNVTIGGNLSCWDHFVAYGMVILAASQIAGEVTILTTNLRGSVAADFSNAHIGKLKFVGKPPAGIFDLSKATADVFEDEPAQWKEVGTLVLDGFEYSAIHMADVTLKLRRDWLRRGTSRRRGRYGGYHSIRYLPQPYEQLASAYRRNGEDHHARRLLLDKHRQRNRATSWRQWYNRLWNLTQDALVGYGYAPGRAAIWLIGLFAVGTLIFRYGLQPISTQPRAFTFADSVVYTFNLLMPIIGINGTGKWQTAPGPEQILATALVIFSWILGATIVAAVSRRLTQT
jgi:uncharacterized protein YjbI with pentapeptide repeats